MHGRKCAWDRESGMPRDLEQLDLQRMPNNGAMLVSERLAQSCKFSGGGA